MKFSKRVAIGVGVGLMLLALGGTGVMAATTLTGQDAPSVVGAQVQGETPTPDGSTSTTGGKGARVGEIASVDGNTLTLNVRGQSGVQQKVQINDQTVVWNGKNKGSSADLTTGTWVAVQGTAESDGSITAQRILTLPADTKDLLDQRGQGKQGRGRFGPMGRNMMGGQMGQMSAVIDAVTKKLNMTAPEIMTALQNGQTLAQIAQSKGVSEQDLKTTITTSINDTLQQRVTAGNLTQGQADAMKTFVQNNVDQLLNTSLKDMPFGGRGMGMHWGTGGLQKQGSQTS